MKLLPCARQAVETWENTDLGKGVWGSEQRLEGSGRLVQEGEGRLFQANCLCRTVMMTGASGTGVSEALGAQRSSSSPKNTTVQAFHHLARSPSVVLCG